MFSRNFAYNQSRAAASRATRRRRSSTTCRWCPLPAWRSSTSRPVAGVFGGYNRHRRVEGPGRQRVQDHRLLLVDRRQGPHRRGSMDIEPSIGYGPVFKIDNFATGANRIQVAPVDYRHIRAGGGVRMPDSRALLGRRRTTCTSSAPATSSSDEVLRGQRRRRRAVRRRHHPARLRQGLRLPAGPRLPPHRLRLHPRRR